MKLPNWSEAKVPREKITDYLLAFNHPDGQSKAQFFSRFGFSMESWQIMAEALRQHAAEHHVLHIEGSPFGTRYVIEGAVQTPDHRDPDIRTVWFVETDETIPRFVTAYPARRKDDQGNG